MKKFIYLFVFVVFFVVLYFVYFSLNNKKSENASSATPTPTHEPELTETITKNPEKQILTDEYKSTWILIRDIGKLQLIPNLEDKLTTSEAKDKYGCLNITSATFWKESDDFIGLFIKNGEKINEAIASDTFNGYFWINDLGIARIAKVLPGDEEIINAIQSGPILMLSGIAQEITTSSDENARRIVLATDRNENVVIIAIYYSQNPLIGPRLEELPEILEKINNKTSLELKNAINLDGGAHSSFISETINLTEISPVGSFFCVLP